MVSQEEAAEAPHSKSCGPATSVRGSSASSKLRPRTCRPSSPLITWTKAMLVSTRSSILHRVELLLLACQTLACGARPTVALSTCSSEKGCRWRAHLTCLVRLDVGSALISVMMAWSPMPEQAAASSNLAPSLLRLVPAFRPGHGENFSHVSTSHQPKLPVPLLRLPTFLLPGLACVLPGLLSFRKLQSFHAFLGPWHPPSVKRCLKRIELA